MLREIIEIVLAAMLLVGSVVTAVKYWSGAKTYKHLHEDILVLRSDMAKAVGKCKEDLQACQGSHESCRQDVVNHLRDKSAHRDTELEEFRFTTLEKTLVALKEDFNRGLEKIETSVCDRLARLETTVINANGVGGKRT